MAAIRRCQNLEKAMISTKIPPWLMSAFSTCGFGGNLSLLDFAGRPRCLSWWLFWPNGVACTKYKSSFCLFVFFPTIIILIITITIIFFFFSASSSSSFFSLIFTLTLTLQRKTVYNILFYFFQFAQEKPKGNESWTQYPMV